MKIRDKVKIVNNEMKSEKTAVNDKNTEKKPVMDYKKHSSLVSRISAFYTNMFATWISVSLVVIFVLMLAFNVYSLISETKPYFDSVGKTGDTALIIEQVNSIKEGRFVLLNNEGEIIASSFLEVTSIEDPGLVGFDIINGRIYFTYARDYIISDGNMLKLVNFSDVTVFMLEIVSIGAAAILLFLVSMLTIYVRGNYLTRKAFGVLDELIIKANNISSQNLNLRLNVSDSTDELVEFAVTFNNMMDRIEKAYEKQNQFVSDASHELRTPIAVIQGYARMLERWGKDDKDILQESITAINKESKCMQDLVDKLLFIARNDKDTLVLVKNKFDMSELVQELIRDTQTLGTKHRIKSSVEPGVNIYGDRDRIKQALRIFVDNALKYTESGRAITIRLEVEKDSAIVVIKDAGMGIPEKDLPNIFDRFFRVDSARERDKGGHGLGLSIARIIVLRHGGRIKVASKLGEGTRFSIYLPLDQSKPDESVHISALN